MVILCFVLVLPMFCACSKPKLPEYMLSMEYKDGFKIMQLADVQAETEAECESAFVEISRLVENTNPDLIVLTGDNIYIPKDESLLSCFIENMEALNTPWAPVFGNHDAEGVLTKEFMAEKFMEAEHCLFHKGDENIDGVGNYVINLMSKNEIKYSLFMIDSNMYHGDDKSVYDTIHQNQIDWYESSVNALAQYNGKTAPKSLAFFHIPLFEFIDARDSYLRGESLGNVNLNEGIFPGFENTGFFKKAKSLNSTIGIFCGHDHANNCDIIYQGIHLVYGLKSSKNSYYNPSLLGTTIITLDEDNMLIYNAHFE